MEGWERRGTNLEELIHEASDNLGMECTLFTIGIHVFLQILLAELGTKRICQSLLSRNVKGETYLEDENQSGFSVLDIVQSDDVWVFQFCKR